MVNYSPQARSTSGSYYPTKADGPGAKAYAVTAPQPTTYYGKALTPALKNEYWSNGQDRAYAQQDAYSQGGTRALLQASPSFAPAFQNSALSYTPGLGRSAANQYNQQYGGAARFYGGYKSKSKSRSRTCKKGKSRRGRHKIIKRKSMSRRVRGGLRPVHPPGGEPPPIVIRFPVERPIRVESGAQAPVARRY